MRARLLAQATVAGSVGGQIDEHNVPLLDFAAARVGGDVDALPGFISARSIDFIAGHHVDGLEVCHFCAAFVSVMVKAEPQMCAFVSVKVLSLIHI